MEPPPGGPPDEAPPQLVQTLPDSFATLPGFDDDVEFRFDEVISEGGSPSQGQGTGDLEKLVIVSPTTRFPKVRWRRNRIAVRPDEGWQPDRVYRVELLPGVTDLQRNRSDRGAVLTFSTGAPRPEATYEGTVVDWTSGRPAPLALVVATLLPDSLPYRGLADSSGHFSLGPLPAGEIILSGVLDENRNHLADPREAFDTVRVKGRRDSALELWAFVHDTAPPRIRSVTPVDSASATDRVHPVAGPEAASPACGRARVAAAGLDAGSRRRRSCPVRWTTAFTRRSRPRRTRRPRTPPRRIRSRHGCRRRPAPGRRSQRRAALEPLKGRPPLSDQLVLRPASPWRPGARYTVEIRGVRNVTGVTGDVVGTLVVPEPPSARHPRRARRLVGARPIRREGSRFLRSRRHRRRPRPRPRPTKPAPAKPAPSEARADDTPSERPAARAPVRRPAAARPGDSGAPRSGAKDRGCGRGPGIACRGAETSGRGARELGHRRARAPRRPRSTEPPAGAQRHRRRAPHQPRPRAAGAGGGRGDGSGRDRVQQPGVRPGQRHAREPRRPLPRVASRGHRRGGRPGREQRGGGAAARAVGARVGAGGRDLAG